MAAFLAIKLLLLINAISNAEVVKCGKKQNCKCVLDGACTIECIGKDQCKDSDISMTCRTGYPCTIKCIGEGACSDARLIGQYATDVSVTCDGKDACKGGNGQLLCGSGDCSVICDGGKEGGACLDTRFKSNNARSFQCTGPDCNEANLPPQYSPDPTLSPTRSPIKPTPKPTTTPKPSSKSPTPAPTSGPSAAPIPAPTKSPTKAPSPSPTAVPTKVTTPTFTTTAAPIKTPTVSPTPSPTPAPSSAPSRSPLEHGVTHAPTKSTTLNPTQYPSPSPSPSPTPAPSPAPTTALALVSRAPIHPQDGIDEQHEEWEMHPHEHEHTAENVVFIVLGLVFLAFCICLILFCKKTKKDKRQKEYDAQYRTKGNKATNHLPDPDNEVSVERQPWKQKDEEQSIVGQMERVMSASLNAPGSPICYTLEGTHTDKNKKYEEAINTVDSYLEDNQVGTIRALKGASSVYQSVATSMKCGVLREDSMDSQTTYGHATEEKEEVISDENFQMQRKRGKEEYGGLHKKGAMSTGSDALFGQIMNSIAVNEVSVMNDIFDDMDDCKTKQSDDASSMDEVYNDNALYQQSDPEESLLDCFGDAVNENNKLYLD